MSPYRVGDGCPTHERAAPTSLLDYTATGQALLAVSRYLQHAEQSDSWRGDADLLVAVLDAECPGWREAFLRVGKIAERLR
jgi:hypothetical protein